MEICPVGGFNVENFVLRAQQNVNQIPTRDTATRSGLPNIVSALEDLETVAFFLAGASRNYGCADGFEFVRGVRGVSLARASTV